MLRAAYFAQELLSTFGIALGEVALQPSTGGTFIVEIFYAASETSEDETVDAQVQKHVLWDRKAEGGFLETKELKRRVRDIIQPARDLGHVDGKKKSNVPSSTLSQPPPSTSSPTTRDTSITRDSSSTWDTSIKTPQSSATAWESEKSVTEAEAEKDLTEEIDRKVHELMISLNQRPAAINRVKETEGGGGEGERKFTPMDVDVKEEGGDKEGGEKEEVKRNPDGTICEDCN